MTVTYFVFNVSNAEHILVGRCVLYCNNFRSWITAKSVLVCFLFYKNRVRETMLMNPAPVILHHVPYDGISLAGRRGSLASLGIINGT